MSRIDAYDILVKRVTWFLGIMITIQLSIGGLLINHETRITRVEQVSKTFLDNSGIEFMARSIGSETEKRLNEKLDTKADRAMVLEMKDDLTMIKNYILNQKK